MTDLSQSSRPVSRPFAWARKPGRTTLVLIVAAAVYAVISWLILRSAGSPPVQFRIDIRPLLEAAPVVQVHVLGALTAFGVGVILLRGVKGSGLHRKLGYTWVAAMGVTAISSFFITGLNGNNFSLIHGISAWTVIAVPMAVAAARRRNIRKHAKGMTNAFVGGLLVAGLFTFLPGRLLWTIFFQV